MSSLSHGLIPASQIPPPFLILTIYYFSVTYASVLKSHLKNKEVAPGGCQSLLALTSKRAKISESIRLLEARPHGHGGIALNQLVERLRHKADWLDMRIDLELRQSDPRETRATARIGTHLSLNGIRWCSHDVGEAENCMRKDEFRAIEQCKVLCGDKLLQLRIFSDGKLHTYDVLALKATTWRTLATSLVGAGLSLADAMHQVEERARLECGVSALTFRWRPTDKPPRPSGRNRSWVS